MKWWLLCGVAGLALLPVAAVEAGGKGPVWHTDYERAKAEARQSSKPLFVVFRCQP